eukprot:scaffold18.g2019.t1
MAEDEGAQLSNLPQLVPKATFMEDVREYMKDRSVADVLQELREAHQKYKYIEQEILQRKKKLSFKQPELKKCLDAVLLLQQQQEAEQPTAVDFSLSDQVFARAQLRHVEGVNLWLGANVMLEYPLEEARALLEVQLKGCQRQLRVVQVEHEYIKDQLTTTEVSLARVYNYDVMQRKATAS